MELGGISHELTDVTTSVQCLGQLLVTCLFCPPPRRRPGLCLPTPDSSATAAAPMPGPAQTPDTCIPEAHPAARQPQARQRDPEAGGVVRPGHQTLPHLPCCPGLSWLNPPRPGEPPRLQTPTVPQVGTWPLTSTLAASPKEPGVESAWHFGSASCLGNSKCSYGEGEPFTTCLAQGSCQPLSTPPDARPAPP